MLRTKVNSCLCLIVCCISSRTGIHLITNYFSVPKVTAEAYVKALMALLAFSFLHPLLPSQLPSIHLPWDYIRQLKRLRWWKSTRQYTRRWKHEESWKSLAEHHFNLFVLWEAYIMSSTKLSYLSLFNITKKKIKKKNPSITKEMHSAIISGTTFMHSMIVPVTSYFIIPKPAVIFRTNRPFEHSTF